MERTKSKGKESQNSLISMNLKSLSKSLNKISFLNNKLLNNKLLIRNLLLFFIFLFLFFIILENKSTRYYLLLFLFILINVLFSYIKFYLKKFFKNFLYSFEFVLFSTILISFLYGSKTAGFFGTLLMAINYVFEKRFSRFFIITLPLYYLIGYTASFFSDYNIKVIGIIYSIFYNVIANLLSRLLDPNLKSLYFFNLLNFLFNLFLFYFFSESLLNLLRILI